MFLDYLALVILLLGLALVFYTFIYIYDMPYKIAKEREHPQTEAIHVACWLSLFTLHAIWPFVFIWAVSHKKGSKGISLVGDSSGYQTAQIAALEARLHKLEAAK